MARMTDLAEELIAQIIEGLFADEACLADAFLARGISKTFARIIDHRLLTATPLKAYLCNTLDHRKGAIKLLKMNLATHLYEHTRKPNGANTELPNYITLSVNELLKFAPAGADTTETRDAYIKDLATAAVAAEKATAKTLLTRPKPVGRTRWSETRVRWSEGGDNFRRWEYVEGMRMEGKDLAAAAAAAGTTEALWHYLAWDTVQIYDPSLVFGSVLAAAASTGRAAILKKLLKRLHREVGNTCPETLRKVLLDATKAAIRSCRPNTTIVLVSHVLDHFEDLHHGQTDTYSLRHSWCLAAAKTGNVGLVLALLEHLIGYDDQGDPCSQDVVYHSACERGHVAIVEALLNEGLVVTCAKARWRKQPIFSAIRYNSQGVFKLLIRHGERYNALELWQTAVRSDKASPLRIAQFLIDEGLPITNDVVQAVTGLTYSYDELTEDQKMVIVLVCDKISKATRLDDLKARQILYLREAMESILEECEDRRKELSAKQLSFEEMAKEALVSFDRAES